jgi:quercetin dioxygenase-like cupin family protein
MQHWTADEVLGSPQEHTFRRMVVQHERIRAGLLGYAAGAVVGLHAHLQSDEVFHLLSGAATFVVDGVPHEVAAGDLLFVEAGERHEIRVHDAPIVLLAAVAPNLDDAWIPQPGAASSAAPSSGR